MKQDQNIVKQTAEALGVTLKELGAIMGVNEGTPAQWSSKGNIPDQAVKHMDLLLQNHQDKAQLESLKNALKTIKEIA